MKISKGLKKQEIWAVGQEIVSILGEDRDEKGGKRHTLPDTEKRLVAEIYDPILLTDINAINKLEPTKRDTVFALYGRYPRIIEYDGVSVSWDPRIHVDVWCPTIDTMVFVDSMRSSGEVLTDDVKTIADIGAASGFLGKYAVCKCKNTQELHLVDINPYAIDCAKDNMKDLEKSIIVCYYVMDGRRLAGKKYNLVLVSPPYVPRPKSIEGSPYEGVGLLHDMIVNGREYLTENGKLIITTSSLCEDITEQAIDEAKNKDLESVEVIGRKDEPLKVMSILNNKEWMPYLLDRGLKETNERGYKYWHEVRILKLLYE